VGQILGRLGGEKWGHKFTDSQVQTPPGPSLTTRGEKRQVLSPNSAVSSAEAECDQKENSYENHG